MCWQQSNTILRHQSVKLAASLGLAIFLRYEFQYHAYTSPNLDRTW